MPSVQTYANDLFNAFNAFDHEALSAMSTEELEAQTEARNVLRKYVDQMWESAKRAGLDPATRPEWDAVAGMRDLTEWVWMNAAGYRDERARD